MYKYVLKLGTSRINRQFPRGVEIFSKLRKKNEIKNANIVELEVEFSQNVQDNKRIKRPTCGFIIPSLIRLLLLDTLGSNRLVHGPTTSNSLPRP